MATLSLKAHAVNNTGHIQINGADALVLNGGITVNGPSSSGTLVLTSHILNIGTSQIALDRQSGAMTLNGVNIDGSATKWDGATKTVSTSTPTGGVDGDIWFQYTA